MKRGIAALSSQVKRVAKDNNWNWQLSALLEVSPLPPRTGVYARYRARGADYGPVESRTIDVGVERICSVEVAVDEPRPSMNHRSLYLGHILGKGVDDICTFISIVLLEQQVDSLANELPAVRWLSAMPTAFRQPIQLS